VIDVGGSSLLDLSFFSRFLANYLSMTRLPLAK
jgi:hypothetical protein